MTPELLGLESALAFERQKVGELTDRLAHMAETAANNYASAVDFQQRAEAAEAALETRTRERDALLASLAWLEQEMREWAGPASEWDQNDDTPKQVLEWADTLQSLRSQEGT